MRNAAAALVAIICWAGLAVQFSATYGHERDVVVTLWTLARFFTVITNLLLAVTMTAVAIGRKVSPFILGGITLAALVVAVVYATLLAGLIDLRGGALVADILLHKVSAIAMAMWWLFFAPKRALNWGAPVRWAVYPVGYFAYVLVRGHYDGRYPYPFINVDKLGWMQTLINAGGIAMGFIIAGFLLVWIDSWRPLGPSGGRR